MNRSGQLAEERARVFITKRGYCILETNFACKIGEIDIIAWDHGILCFIEVKSRKNTTFGFPCEFVNFQKQQKIIKVANYYLSQKRFVKPPICRFDIISIIGNEIPEIFCNAFQINEK